LNPATLQLINTIVGALIIAAIIGLARWIMGKADKTALDDTRKEVESKASSHDVSKLEVKLDAALLIVGATITRPELAEKLLALTGRTDDKMARVLADIVQLNTDVKANAKAGVDTDKRLDDIPARVRQLEENQKRGN
jgi:hypothetical protein